MLREQDAPGAITTKDCGRTWLLLRTERLAVRQVLKPSSNSADQLESLVLLIRDLLELNKGSQRIPAYSQRAEDWHCFSHGLAQVLDGSQLHVDGREIEGHHGDLVGQSTFHKASASAQQRGLRSAKVPEIAQQLTLLPGSAQEDESVLELLVELAGLEIE